MKFAKVFPFLLLAIGISIYFTAGTLHTRQKAEMSRAAVALENCYRFVFEHAMSRGTSLPATLAEIPEWERHVESTADPEMQRMYRRINYAYDKERTTEGMRLATIELERMRVILMNGGAIISEPTRKSTGQSDSGAPPQGVGPP